MQQNAEGRAFTMTNLGAPNFASSPPLWVHDCPVWFGTIPAVHLQTRSMCWLRDMLRDNPENSHNEELTRGLKISVEKENQSTIFFVKNEF